MMQSFHFASVGVFLLSQSRIMGEGASQTTEPSSVASVCPRVCIFDIDNTVTVGEHCQVLRDDVISEPAPQWPSNSGTTSVVKQALKQCHDNGYQLAFASAESKDQERIPEQRKFITSLEPVADMFNAEFFASPAYQGAWNILAHSSTTDKLEFANKQPMIMNILRYYEAPPSCFNQSIMFDDVVENLHAAHALGLRVAQASIECGGSYCSHGCGLSSAALHVIQPPPSAEESGFKSTGESTLDNQSVELTETTIPTTTTLGFLASTSAQKPTAAAVTPNENITGEAFADTTAAVSTTSAIDKSTVSAEESNVLSNAQTNSVLLSLAAGLLSQFLLE